MGSSKFDEMLDLDSKVQVTNGGEKTKVVVSTQHKKAIDMEKLFKKFLILFLIMLNLNLS